MNSWIVSVGLILVFLVSSIGSPTLSALSQGADAGSSVSSSSGDSYSKVPAQLPTILQQAQQFGMLNSSAPMSVQMVLSLRNSVGLSNELMSMYDPSSPTYHHFLSAAQFNQLYGSSPAELSALTDYLRAKGLQVQVGGASTTNLVTLKGTAQQMEDAFKTQMGLFKYNGQSFYSAVSSPQLPKAFSNVQMIYGLQNYGASAGSAVPLYRDLGPVNKSEAPSSSVYYSPPEIREAYNATGLYSEGYDGTGITIAIVDAYGDPYIQSELGVFSSSFNLPQTNVTVVCVDGPCDYYNGIYTGWNGEIALDVEWAHAMAPGATIDLYIGSNSGQPLYDAVQAAVNDSSTNIISMSWAEPENDFGSSASVAPVYGENYPWLDQVLQEAAAVGITSLASTGDWGAYEQSFGQTSPYGGAMYPSTDPYVTGVGGTSLYMSTSSGYLQMPYANATGGYGAETAWSWNNVQGWGTGGGESTLFARPEWQTGLGLSGTTMRGAPDISWDADPQTGVLVFVEGGFNIYGGTSVGSPSLAGSLATLEQKAGERLGLINPTLYSILNNASEYSKAFHDVTVGNNNPNSASPGWDSLTGVGSPNLGELANYLAPTGRIDVVAASNVSLGTSASYSNVIEITAHAFYGGANVTSGTGFAEILSPDGDLLANVTIWPGAREWTGDFRINSTDPPGSWTATVHIASGGQSGMGSTIFSVGDGLTLFAPYTVAGEFVVGQTIPVSVAITGGGGGGGGGGVVTSGTFSAVFTFQTATGTLEGMIPLAYNSSTSRWEGNFTVPSYADQGPWVLTVNGTDSSGNRGSTYAWLNVGLNLLNIYTFDQYGDPTPTFVLNDTIIILALPINPYYGLVLNGSFSATISYGSTVLGTVPLYNYGYGEWINAVQINSSDPVGFYTITVSGNDGLGNSGSSFTVIRVAPYNLNVSASTTSLYITDTGSLQIRASVTYPNGTEMTVGSVNAIVLYEGWGEVHDVRLTYNSALGEFVGVIQGEGPLYTPPGEYEVVLSAVDPVGSYGYGVAFFDITDIFLAPSMGAAGTTVTITGAGFYGWQSLMVTYDGSADGMPTTCTTDAFGNMNSGCMFAVPPSDLGNYTVMVSDFTNSATANFTVTLLGVTCSKSTVVVGSATTCKATVHESSTAAPTGTVTWSNSSSGTFSKTSCTLSRHKTYSTCSVKFTPTTAGSVVLTASYGGDSNNPATAGGYNLVVTMKATKTTVSCTPRSAVAGSSTIITCTVKVKGYAPTGDVSWSNSNSSTGSVFFFDSDCYLSQGTCSVMMMGATSGHVIINATYWGDQNNLGSSRTATLTIKKAPTITTASCTQMFPVVGTPVTCTATISGPYSSPNGTVTWSRVSGTGKVTFFQTTCTLTGGSCQVTIMPTAAGHVKIKATYSGDSNDLKSSGTSVLTIIS